MPLQTALDLDGALAIDEHLERTHVKNMSIVGMSVFICAVCHRCSRQTMELQIKTAAQMRDQGHALKQKALDLVNEAERKVWPSLSKIMTGVIV